MIYRNKFITQNDIIEALWVNEIGSPYNSLKTLYIVLGLQLGKWYFKR